MDPFTVWIVDSSTLADLVEITAMIANTTDKPESNNAVVAYITHYINARLTDGVPIKTPSPEESRRMLSALVRIMSVNHAKSNHTWLIRKCIAIIPYPVLAGQFHGKNGSTTFTIEAVLHKQWDVITGIIDAVGTDVLSIASFETVYDDFDANAPCTPVTVCSIEDAPKLARAVVNVMNWGLLTCVYNNRSHIGNKPFGCYIVDVLCESDAPHRQIAEVYRAAREDRVDDLQQMRDVYVFLSDIVHHNYTKRAAIGLLRVASEASYAEYGIYTLCKLTQAFCKTGDADILREALRCAPRSMLEYYRDDFFHAAIDVRDDANDRLKFMVRPPYCLPTPPSMNTADAPAHISKEDLRKYNAAKQFAHDTAIRVELVIKMVNFAMQQKSAAAASAADGASDNVNINQT